MLSMVDLILRRSLPKSVAAYLAVAMKSGISLLIGARPGAAGKTTVMGALLGLLPADHEITIIEDEDHASRLTPGSPSHPRTYVIHEIGEGHWYGYLWGQPVLHAVEAVQPNTYLATNMHPDTFPEVHDTFADFGDKEALKRFDLILFLRMHPKTESRSIHEIWEYQAGTHERIYTEKEGGLISLTECRFGKNITQIQANEKKLTYCLENHINLIEDVARVFNES